MAGQLFLCATPIGNLGDITFRVIDTLKMVDLIAAEDTRNSIKLLNHFQIKTPMTSYHEFNKLKKGSFLISQLVAGKNIALITDAGMPAISDPGEELVLMAYEAGIEVTALPGACAFVTAVTLSGLPAGRFVFEAFLPTDRKNREKRLEVLKGEVRTVILYEAPHRLLKTLNELYEFLGDRRVAVCRELTKKHETVFRALLSEAAGFYEKNMPRGECVIVLEGANAEHLHQQARAKWMDLSLEAHMEHYLSQGMDKKAAMKAVASDRGVSKRDIYQSLIET